MRDAGSPNRWEVFQVGPATGFITLRAGHPADDPLATVRELLDGIAPGAGIARAHQVHGREVFLAEGPTFLPYPRADALVTDKKGLAVVVLTADCFPVLLADERSRVAGAVHAGRRGALADVVGAALELIERRFAVGLSSLFAQVGPGIGPCCYEVSDEIADEFAGRWGERFVRRVPDGGPRLDLPGLVLHQLLARGVSPDRITASGDCTRCRSDRYWSHRALGEAAGRMATGVLLEGR
ncbi:MAG: polyphenol oxidase family protein [bacterium]|nr:polyphenol oxidase family protein [bacterium]